jgi:aminoglycoside phosphotransferase
MSALAFDTLKFTKTLQSAGFATEQAEAVAIAFRDASSDTELATKKDIALAVAELKGEMSTVRWMLGAVLALAVANFAKQYF